jgi:hypothetical protein
VTAYLFFASMDVDPDKEELFNEVYDTEHVPSLMKVPGVVSVRRYTTEPLILSIGGEEKQIPNDGLPKHTAIYEIESPDVLTSAEWSDAVEAGRWPEEVRPFTHNRQHVLRKILGAG